MWPYRSNLGATRRRALAEMALIELLETAERTFYVELPDLPVWRGCERGCERGLLWTTDRACRRICAGHEPISDARARRNSNAGTYLPLFLQPNELALDPRRVRKVRKEPLAAEHHEATGI